MEFLLFVSFRVFAAETTSDGPNYHSESWSRVSSLRGSKASHEVEFRFFEAAKRLMKSSCLLVLFFPRLSRLLKAPIVTASHEVEF